MGYEQITDALGALEDNFLQYIPSEQVRRGLGRIHLAMPYSNNADIAPGNFRTDNPELPRVTPLERVIGITPSMKQRDAIADRERQMIGPENKTLLQEANRYGVDTTFEQDGQSGYRSRQNIRGDLERLTESIQALSKDDGTDPINMRRLGLKSLTERTVKGEDGNTRIEPVTPEDIRDLAGAYRTRRDVTSQLTKLGVTPEKGSTLPQLQKQLRSAQVKKQQEDTRNEDVNRYGTLNPDGSRSGGTTAGRMELEQARDQLDTNQSNRDLTARQIESSRNTDAINTLVTNQGIKQQNYTNERDAYEFEKNLEQLAAEREYNKQVQAAEFAAQTQQIEMQNAADMERYQLMLQNDREVRRGDDISDLMAALTMLGGTFMI